MAAGNTSNNRRNRRDVIKAGAGLAAAATSLKLGMVTAQEQSEKTGVDPTEWTPEHIKEIAGTYEPDTKADVEKVVPLDHEGTFDYWYVGPDQTTPEIQKEKESEFWTAWDETYTNIAMEDGDNVLNIGYNDLLDKARTAATGKAAPNLARFPILWGVEFAARGQLQELKLEDFGFTEESFWPGALKSCRWEDKLYGIPTNNETMAFIWNAQMFKDAGLDPDTPPATWDEVVEFSKAIKESTGKAGYGLVARVNAGNTPFRFMPMLWAYGSGALDEAEESPTYENVMINNDGGIAALQAAYDMYVRDKSVPASALTNTQTENGDLFIAGEVAMMISHPSEYASLRDKASKAQGADKELADEIVNNVRYGLIPEGPVRRAVVFGGSNMHVFSNDVVSSEGDFDAMRAFTAFNCGPEWSTKLAWTGSNPGHLRGFETPAMKERLESIPFLDVTTAMLPYGVPFPVIPEATQIMNEIVPNMLQNALTETMSVQEAADQAADEISTLRGGGF